MSISISRRSIARRVTAVALMAAAGLAGGGLVNTADAAGLVSVTSGRLNVTGGDEPNAFSVNGTGGGAFTVTDSQPGASMSAGAGCFLSTATTVKCSGVTQFLSISTRGGDDLVRLRNTNLPSFVSGGAGRDVLIGSSTAKDLLTGGADDDVLQGGGDDLLNGGSGTDKCSGVPDSQKTGCES